MKKSKEKATPSKTIRVATDVNSTDTSVTSPSNSISKWKPSPENLAIIAAILTHGSKMEPCVAIHEAFNLCIVARAKIEGEVIEEKDFRFLEEVQQEFHEGIVWPKSFPATFNEFLRLVVAFRETDALPRFRQFLFSEGKDDAAIDKAIGELRNPERKLAYEEWRDRATDYNRWWKTEVKKIRSKSGRIKKSTKVQSRDKKFPSGAK